MKAPSRPKGLCATPMHLDKVFIRYGAYIERLEGPVEYGLEQPVALTNPQRLKL